MMTAIGQLALILSLFSGSNAWWVAGPSTGGSCYAPPLVFGATCRSSTALLGSPGWKIGYRIEPTGNVPTLLCCEAMGCGAMGSKDCSGAFGMYSIGCASGGILTATLPWGNNAATPAIRCKGVVTGMSVTWSH